MKYRGQIDALTKQNESEKKQLQEHLQSLILSHQGQLSKREKEFEKLERSLKDQRTVMETLNKDRCERSAVFIGNVLTQTFHLCTQKCCPSLSTKN